MISPWLPMASAVRREMLRFFRQRGRVVGSLGTPIFLWIFLASGLGAAFPAAATGAGGYTAYFYPGVVALTVLFSSLFSSISIIEDRHEGFLQGVLVAPVSPVALVGGKVIGGALIALVQGALLLLAAPFVGVALAPAGVLGAALTLSAVAVALSSLGFVFAWRLDSVQGFHGVMNLLLFPMWLLSGSFFPVSGAPGWLKPLMILNPLTYGLNAFKLSLAGELGAPFWSNFAVMGLFAGVVFGLAVGVVTRMKEVSS